jgi:hypothetical protein
VSPSYVALDVPVGINGVASGSMGTPPFRDGRSRDGSMGTPPLQINGDTTKPPRCVCPHRTVCVPRVRSLAVCVPRVRSLAIYYGDLIRQGHVHDYAEIATLGHVTRARVTQIMNLRLLTPDIQDELLKLPRITRGHDTLSLRSLQLVALQPEWPEQRWRWREINEQSLNRRPPTTMYESLLMPECSYPLR